MSANLNVVCRAVTVRLRNVPPFALFVELYGDFSPRKNQSRNFAHIFRYCSRRSYGSTKSFGQMRLRRKLRSFFVPL